MQRIVLSSIGLLFGLAFLLPPAWAAVDRDQAAAMAQRVAAGRVLAVERGVYLDNSIVWRVQVLTPAGEVRLVVLDAATGRTR
jgi:uncharacterized membrane protein YkoI